MGKTKLKNKGKDTPFQELIRTVSNYDQARTKRTFLEKEMDRISRELHQTKEAETRHRGHIVSLLQLPELMAEATIMASCPEVTSVQFTNGNGNGQEVGIGILAGEIVDPDIENLTEVIGSAD